MPHTVEAGLGGFSEVIGPGQHGEFEVIVCLEVVDQLRTAAHVSVLKFARGALADNIVEVRQCRVDGVVAARPAQNGVAGKPHPAAARVGGGAAELISRFQ